MSRRALESMVDRRVSEAQGRETEARLRSPGLGEGESAELKQARKDLREWKQVQAELEDE